MSSASTSARTTTFVGRQQQIHLLEEELERARSGDPRFVLMSGPSGIGKTALIQRFLTWAETRAAHLAVVSADEQERHLRFGVLSRLMAAVEEGGPPPLPPDLEDPIAAGVQVLDRLGCLPAPVTVLVVEDAQWADRASLDALTFVLRRLHVEPVLCVMAVRDEVPALPEGLVKLADDGRGRRLSLAGLTVEDITELAAANGTPRLPRAAAVRLRDDTDGNPLHVRALLEELDAGELTRTRGTLPAPRSFRVLMLSRLAGCAAHTEQLVAAAAVCGHRASLALVADVADVVDTLGATDEAVAAGFLHLVDGADGPLVLFSHPLRRAAVYHDLGPRRRASLHARAAERTDGMVALRHRIAAATPPDPALSAELVEHASAAMESGSLDVAGEHLLAALRLASPGCDRTKLLLRTVEVLLEGGRLADALALRDQLLALPAGQRRSYLLGSVALLLGNHDEAAAELARAWDGTGDDDEQQLSARAAIQLGDLRIIQARPADAVVWARRALAGPLDPTAEAAARRVLILGRGMSGDIEEPSDLDELADGLAEGDERSTFEPLLARGIVRLWIDDLRGAEHDLSTVASATEGRCPLRVRLGGVACLAKTRYHLGDWDAAAAAASVAVSLAEDAEHRWALAFLHASATLVPAARGEWEVARHHARQARVAADLTGHATDLAYAAHAEAQLAFCQDDHDGVIAAVAPAVGLLGEGHIEEPGALPWYEMYGHALVSAQRYEEAEAVLDQLAASPAVRRRRLATAHLEGIRGRLAAARGDRSAAVEAFERALALFDDHPAVFDRALLHDVYGRVCRRMGRRRHAAAHLGTAAEAYRVLGATPFLDRCDRELAGCGLRPGPRTVEARQALTPQEEIVSRLVAGGMTNRQVAAELVVSVKTVEYHLGNIYRKLGLSSRTQLAAHRAGQAVSARDRREP